jgi:dUTP pyrophosphatase
MSISFELQRKRAFRRKMIHIGIRTERGAAVPSYESEGAAGADVCACLDGDMHIAPGAVALVPTGIFIEVPQGYEAQIRPRSGLAIKHGITLLNTPGTIDSDYRGEIKIIMINFGKEQFTVRNGMRIAQMIFAKVYKGDFVITDSLSATKRGSGGFGHTGV